MEEGVMTGSNNYLYTQAELIRATPIIEDALQRCNADLMRTFETIDNPIGYLKQKINTKVGRVDDIIQVSFSSAFSAEAAQIVNATVDAYVTFHASRKRSTSLEVLRILQAEKADRNQELTAKLQEINAFKQEHEALVYQTDQGNLIVQRLSRLSEALTDAQLNVVESKSLYDTSKQMISDSNGLEQFVDVYRSRGSSILADTDIGRLRDNLDTFQRQRTDRMQRLHENHPAVKVLDAEIDRIEEQIKQRNEQYALAQLAFIEQQYLAAKEREEQLGQRYQQQHNEAVALNRQLDQYALLQAHCEQIQRSCDILDDRIKELSITEEVGALNITILEVADVSARPSWPDRSKCMMLAILGGFFIGGAGAWIRDMLSSHINRIGEVAEVLNAPVLGVVPTLASRSSMSDRGQIVWQEPASIASEAFRGIRTSIIFSFPEEQIRLIHITSAFAGAGKSMLVSNLGIAFAKSHARTLILDADLRRPTQHTLFKTKRDVGLSTLLAGLCPLQDTIVSTSCKGLDLLPSGPLVPNATELLGSDRFHDILADLKTHYDRILIDSPPVLPVADGCILAALSDATIVVVRAGKTQRKALVRLQESIDRVGGRIIGSVVNDVCRGDMGYGKYSYGCKGDGKGQSPGNNGDKKQYMHERLATMMEVQSPLERK
jgi:capsular exopolysaccharide synthesis family protein